MKRILFACLVVTLIPVAAARAGPVLYGVTLTNLVIVNQNDPSQVVVVGPTGLSGLGMVRPISLTYNPGDGYLYGIGYDQPTGTDRTSQYLFRIDRLTGAGSIVTTLFGDPDSTADKIMGLEYVETLHSLVATRGFGDDMMLMTTSGATTSLLQNGVINHWIAFDSSSNVLFTVGAARVSGAEQLWSTDPLSSGATTATLLGDLPYPLAADIAYNPADHFIYGATGPYPPGYAFDLYKIQTTNVYEATPYVRVGSVAGDNLYGVAFAPAVPDPASTLLLFGMSLTGLVAAKRRWR
jgi:hypothetical protein